MPYGGSAEKAKHNCLSTEKSKSEKDRLTADGGDARAGENGTMEGKSGGGDTESVSAIIHVCDVKRSAKFVKLLSWLDRFLFNKVILFKMWGKDKIEKYNCI